MRWLVSGMRVAVASAQPRAERAGPVGSLAAMIGPCRGHTARKGVRTLRGDPVGASRLERRCCGAVFSPKHGCTALLAGGGNHASLWDAMRGRSLFYSPNPLKTIYLKKKTGVPSGFEPTNKGLAGLCRGARQRPDQAVRY